MAENIEYRRETKEEQEKNWKVGDDCVDNKYRREIEYRKEFNVYDFNDFKDNIYSCYINMHYYTIHNRYAWAEEEAQLGINLSTKYIDNINDKDTKFYALKFIPNFYWISEKKENKEQLKKWVDASEYILTQKKMKKFYYMNGALANIKYGDFDKAKEYINCLYEIKQRSRLNESVVYKLERFYAFIIEYLTDTKKYSEMLPTLISCFKFAFDEDQKGSKKLYSEQGFEVDKKDYIIGLRYIWYKYFSGRDWDTISPIEVIQSERYGIKGLQDC